MNTISSLAWLGTGQCDPNKDLKETLTILAVVAGWAIVVYLLRRLWKSDATKTLKVVVTTLAIAISICLTVFVYAISVIAFACSGG